MAAEGHMLSNIEPARNPLVGRQVTLWRNDVLPEVQIVNGSLLITHVDVEREQIDWWECSSAQDLKQSRETIALVVWLW